MEKVTDIRRIRRKADPMDTARSKTNTLAQYQLQKENMQYDIPYMKTAPVVQNDAMAKAVENSLNKTGVYSVKKPPKQKHVSFFKSGNKWGFIVY